MTTSAAIAPLPDEAVGSEASAQSDVQNTLEISDTTSSNPTQSMESLQKRNSELEKELKAAQVDAKETLLALLQMAEGVRVITKHMQSASYQNDDDSDSEESKSEELTEQLFSDSIVRETCLRGTVFGTDLLRLWDAGHHVRDYARMVSEESKLSVEDVIQAQTTAQQALERAEKAEGVVRSLQMQNSTLKTQLAKTGSERRVLLKEVKSLRQHMAASRKIEMERLLRQHVEGALLLHEDHIKAMTVQQRNQKHFEEEKKDEEELELVKAEDCQEDGSEDDMKVQEAAEETSTGRAVESGETSKEIPKPDTAPILENSEKDLNVEDSEEEAIKSSKDDGDNHAKEEDVESDHSEGPSPSESKTVPGIFKIGEPSEPKMAQNKSVQEPSTSASFDGNDGMLGFGSEFHKSWARPKPVDHPESQSQPTSASASEANKKESCKDEIDTKNDSLKPSANAPMEPSSATCSQGTANKENKQLEANQRELKQLPSPVSSKEKTLDSTNVQSTSYSPVKLFSSFGRTPPAPPQSHQAAVQKPESSRSVGSTGSTESSGGGPGVGTKVMNFLFYPEKKHQYQQQPVQAAPKPVVEAPVPKKSNALLKLSASEDSAEKGGPSVDETAATTTITPASSCAASRARTLSGENDNSITTGQLHKSVSSPIRIVPGSVSWSEDNQSIQSNLPSPQFQYSDIILGSDVAGGTGEKTVELYKDLKVFRSLAIPNDDEIDDYHYYQHQYQQEMTHESTK